MVLLSSSIYYYLKEHAKTTTWPAAELACPWQAAKSIERTLKRWPVVMMVIVLQELLVYNQLNMFSITYLFEFSGVRAVRHI